MDNCEFCLEFSDNQDQLSPFKELLGGRSTRILSTSPNFIVFPGLGGFVPGYLLMIPKQHYLSIAQTADGHKDEFETLQQRVRQVLTEYYIPPIFYEHGPLSENSKGGCCITHAHLHALPLAYDLIQDLQNMLEGEKVRRIFDAANWINSNKSYIYFETQSEEKYVFACPENIPSQLIRRLIAEKMGKANEWDWLLWPNEEAIMKTITDLANKI